MQENKSRTPSIEKPTGTTGGPVKPAWPPESAIRLSRARLLALMRRRQPGDWVSL